MTSVQILDLGDGRELVVSIRPKAATDENKRTLKDIWLTGAPFSYEYFVSELKRNSVIDDDAVWILRPVRGNHPTASFHVRGCYEALLYFGCLEDLSSFPKVRELFNNTFSTEINCSKVIENKNKCTSELNFFISMFEGFANPDANAESE